MVKQFTLTPGQVSLQLLKQVLIERGHCVLDKACVPKVEASLAVVRQVLQDKKTVYGINTGFGSLAQQTISTEKLQHLQRNIVLSHACGTGALLDDDVVALILLLKINNLAQGYSGVRMELIDALCALYNARVYPCIPAKGSVGASGDLVPLAHLALPLLGEGEMRYKGKIITAKEGLAIAGLNPF